MKGRESISLIIFHPWGLKVFADRIQVRQKPKNYHYALKSTKIICNFVIGRIFHEVNLMAKITTCEHINIYPEENIFFLYIWIREDA